ncbi:putative 26s proteasome non-atpase regulatory subunit 3 [Quercus suber]|uniref:26s proteasome non-atpase regulatory subunit 3 n=1 Tax=Quercus suber TaxID=58331 RepID=A0AAW0LTZ0_QUESU
MVLETGDIYSTNEPRWRRLCQRHFNLKPIQISRCKGIPPTRCSESPCCSTSFLSSINSQEDCFYAERHGEGFDFELTNIGDLELLRHVAKKFSSTFNSKWTHNLIVRLQQNVIRTGLCNISLSYSCISLADVAKKLRA